MINDKISLSSNIMIIIYRKRMRIHEKKKREETSKLKIYFEEGQSIPSNVSDSMGMYGLRDIRADH